MAAQSGDTCVLMLHCIIGPTGSIMNMMMMQATTYHMHPIQIVFVTDVDVSKNRMSHTYLVNNRQ